MKQLNSVIYNKLIIQAEEAKAQGMTKLAHNILGSICGSPNDEEIQYSIGDMQDEIQHELWRLASNVLKYYDTKSVDALKLNDIIESLADKFIEGVGGVIKTNAVIAGPFEPPVPGESK
jgi:hypothetical protein